MAMKFSRYNSIDEKPPSAISGELFKLDDDTLKWSPYHFAIEGKLLSWYSGSMSDEAMGSIDLEPMTKCEMEVEDLSIYMYTPGGELTVRAKSEGEMSMWHRAIEMYADMARGGDGTGRLSAAPRQIQRNGPGVHSAEFDHASRSGKFSNGISRDGPGMHSFDCTHASRSGKFNPDAAPEGKDDSAPPGAPVWRSDKMADLDDGRDLTYDEKEENGDIFCAEPKPFEDTQHPHGHHESGQGHMISRNKSSMMHSQEIKYPSVDDK
jgi:hypothetical protein